MKNLKTRILVLCGSMVLLGGLLAPLATASCPSIIVECSNGKVYSCAGTQNGDNCTYSASCLNGGKCKPGPEDEEYAD